MTDPQAIADGLSEAQKRALLYMPAAIDWVMSQAGNSSHFYLTGKGLMSGCFKQRDDKPLRAKFYRLTPLGLAVRAILEKQNG